MSPLYSVWIPSHNIYLYRELNSWMAEQVIRSPSIIIPNITWLAKFLGVSSESPPKSMLKFHVVTNLNRSVMNSQRGGKFYSSQSTCLRVHFLAAQICKVAQMGWKKTNKMMFQEMTSKLNTPFYGVKLSILINSPFWELENLVYLLLLLLLLPLLLLSPSVSSFWYIYDGRLIDFFGPENCWQPNLSPDHRIKPTDLSPAK